MRTNLAKNKLVDAKAPNWENFTGKMDPKILIFVLLVIDDPFQHLWEIQTQDNQNILDGGRGNEMDSRKNQQNMPKKMSNKSFIRHFHDGYQGHSFDLLQK